jgi:hypothetical protein
LYSTSTLLDSDICQSVHLLRHQRKSHHLARTRTQVLLLNLTGLPQRPPQLRRLPWIDRHHSEPQRSLRKLQTLVVLTLLAIVDNREHNLAPGPIIITGHSKSFRTNHLPCRHRVISP